MATTAAVDNMQTNRGRQIFNKHTVYILRIYDVQTWIHVFIPYKLQFVQALVFLMSMRLAFKNRLGCIISVFLKSAFSYL